MSVPLALSIAISIRVGNLLGAGDPQRARRAARAVCLLTAVLMAAIAGPRPSALPPPRAPRPPAGASRLRAGLDGGQP